MKGITIDGLKLTEGMLKELTGWYEQQPESTPECYIGYLDQIKDTLIRLMCEQSTKYDDAIKEGLSGIIQIQDSLRNLLPKN